MFVALLAGAEFDNKKILPEAMRVLPLVMNDRNQPDIHAQIAQVVVMEIGRHKK